MEVRSILRSRMHFTHKLQMFAWIKWVCVQDWKDIKNHIASARLTIKFLPPDKFRVGYQGLCETRRSAP